MSPRGTIRAGGNPLSLWRAVRSGEVRPRLAAECWPLIEAGYRAVLAAAAGERAVYGLNTGFGKLALVRVPADRLAELQINLVRSHQAGVGEPLCAPVVRLALALKLASLAHGASGVQPAVCRLLEAMLERDLLPVIPAQGSVGASGDLAPLAHLAAVLIGEGEARFAGERLPGAVALERAGLAPVTLGPKEGLALLNGTQISTALALDALFALEPVFAAGLVVGAASVDAATGSDTPFDPRIQALRGHPGQIAVAAVLRALMAGSAIRRSHLEGDPRVQDPYCLRCQPQVAGACLDLLHQVAATLEREADGVTDNPLVFPDSGEVLSGGNFHAEPVAFAADQMALAIAELGNIAQRRCALLCDPARTGLPAFLVREPGLRSGFMVAEIASAALASENRQKAAPASIDTIPTSIDQEDHVSMAAHAARRLVPMVDNLARIVAIEALMAAQGIELRAPLETSPRLRLFLEAVRAVVPALHEDRPLSPDIEAVTRLVRDGTIAAVLEAEERATLFGARP